MARSANARREPEPDDSMTVYEEMLDAAKQIKGSMKKDATTDQEHLKALIVFLSDIPDKVFNNLSDEAQEWFNDATDAVNERNPIRIPEGYKSIEKSSGGSRRRLAAADEQESEGGDETEDDEQEAEERTSSRRRRAEPEENTTRRSRRAEPEGDAEEELSAARHRRAEPEEDAPEEERPAARRSTRTTEREPATRRAANGTATGGRRGAVRVQAERAPSMVVEIRKFVVKKPNATIEQIMAALAKKNLEPNEATVRVTKQATVATMEELRSLGWRAPAA